MTYGLSRENGFAVGGRTTLHSATRIGRPSRRKHTRPSSASTRHSSVARSRDLRRVFIAGASVLSKPLTRTTASDWRSAGCAAPATVGGMPSSRRTPRPGIACSTSPFASWSSTPALGAAYSSGLPRTTAGRATRHAARGDVRSCSSVNGNAPRRWLLASAVASAPGAVWFSTVRAVGSGHLWLSARVAARQNTAGTGWCRPCQRGSVAGRRPPWWS